VCLPVHADVCGCMNVYLTCDECDCAIVSRQYATCNECGCAIGSCQFATCDECGCAIASRQYATCDECGCALGPALNSLVLVSCLAADIPDCLQQQPLDLNEQARHSELHISAAPLWIRCG
jgi:hypothetical protein